jgi:hypothetical protein
MKLGKLLHALAMERQLLRHCNRCFKPFNVLLVDALFRVSAFGFAVVPWIIGFVGPQFQSADYASWTEYVNHGRRRA